MLEMLSYNPLLIVAGAIISLEVFVLMTMLLVFIVSYSFDTVINDPHGHYATAKNSVSIAKDKSGEVKHTLMQVRTDLVRNATSFDYLKSASNAGNGIYKMLKEAQPQAKALVSRAKMEMPTMGMRIITSQEIIPQVIVGEKDPAVVQADKYKDIFIPAQPARKPSVYPGSKIQQNTTL